MLFLGIDIGTSGVKALLADEDDAVRHEASAALAVSRPQPLRSEQDPQDWWRAVTAALDALVRAGAPMGDVAAIGLSGQMLGVTLLGDDDRPLRPALIWNDGRAGLEGRELEASVPGFAERTGARPMAGFSAPKLRWLAKHEPDTLAKAKLILLPKDYVRLRLTGEAASDISDGSAQLLLDTRRGVYDDDILSACGVARGQLPRLAASEEITGGLSADLAARWHLPPGVPVCGGAGDNMAGGIGAGIVSRGAAYIGLGTSGVYFVANDVFAPALGGGMHTHRHAVPGLFAQHGCVLSAAAALDWVVGATSGGDVGEVVREIEVAPLPLAETPVFTPYLSGERTPHDDPLLTATFSGLTLTTSRRHLVQAVMEGVALAIGDCHRALMDSGAAIEDVALIGGGAASRFWAELVASAIGLPVHAPPFAAFGPALGAARLARRAVGGPLVAASGRPRFVAMPSQALAEGLAMKRLAYERHLRLRAQSPG